MIRWDVPNPHSPRKRTVWLTAACCQRQLRVRTMQLKELITAGARCFRSSRTASDDPITAAAPGNPTCTQHFHATVSQIHFRAEPSRKEYARRTWHRNACFGYHAGEQPVTLGEEYSEGTAGRTTLRWILAADAFSSSQPKPVCTMGPMCSVICRTRPRRDANFPSAGRILPYWKPKPMGLQRRVRLLVLACRSRPFRTLRQLDHCRRSRTVARRHCSAFRGLHAISSKVSWSAACPNRRHHSPCPYISDSFRRFARHRWSLGIVRNHDRASAGSWFRGFVVKGLAQRHPDIAELIPGAALALPAVRAVIARGTVHHAALPSSELVRMRSYTSRWLWQVFESGHGWQCLHSDSALLSRGTNRTGSELTVTCLLQRARAFAPL